VKFFDYLLLFFSFIIIKRLSLLDVRYMKLNVYFFLRLSFTFLCIVFEARNENIPVMKGDNRINV